LSLHFVVIFRTSPHMVGQVLNLPRIYFPTCFTPRRVGLTINWTELSRRLYRHARYRYYDFVPCLENQRFAILGHCKKSRNTDITNPSFVRTCAVMLAEG
jgi:hypothetical protein